LSALRVAQVFGKISQNNKINKVTTQVAIHMAILSAVQKPLAKSKAILVAKDAVNTFTKLFHINIVINNLSLSDFNLLNSFAPNFFCFKNASILCFGIDIKAVSLPEKNADKKNNKIKTNIVTKSIIKIN